MTGLECFVRREVNKWSVDVEGFWTWVVVFGGGSPFDTWFGSVRVGWIRFSMGNNKILFFT